MKKVLQFSGLISLVLAVVAFILMMASPAVVYTSGSSTVSFAGTLAIFGGEVDLAQAVVLGASEAKVAVMGLLAWILVLIGMVIVLCGIILPLLKINALEKFAGLLNLIAVVCFVLGGIFMFIVVPSFFGAVGNSAPDGTGIGAGWVIGGILAIVAGAFAILPAAMDFISKKK